jgi:hypothetical protein
VGIFYEHIVVKGPTQPELVRYMNDARRTGYVSPTVGDITVVYDEASTYHNKLLFALVADISKHFCCAALATLVHDGDVLYYSLYDEGTLIDRYNSCPDYFADELGDGFPAGGDTEKLCLAFSVPDRVDAVSDVLHRKDADEEDANSEEFWSADERHEKLVNALGWPPFIPGIGYDYVDEERFEGKIDTSAFIRTGVT